MASYQGVFFIVQGKDDSNLTKSEQLSFIKQHASKIAHRQKKEKKLTPLFSEARRLVQQTRSINNSDALPRGLVEPKPSEMAVSKPPAPTVARESNNGLLQEDRNPMRGPEAGVQLDAYLDDFVAPAVMEYPLPWEPLRPGIRRDPFDTFAGKSSPGTEYAIDYFIQVLSPSYDPVLLTLSLVNPMMILLFPLMLNHPEVFHAALSITQIHIDKRDQPHRASSREMLFHRLQAISLLQKRLARLKGPPDDAIITTVLFLTAGDRALSAEPSANGKGLRLLVSMRGGLDRLGQGGLLKALLLNVNYFWTLEGAPTTFPEHTKEKNAVLSSHLSPLELGELVADLPMGFMALAYQDRLHLDVIKILKRVTHYLNSKQSSRLQQPPLPDEPHEASPDIFDVCSSLQSSSDAEGFNLNKILCLAVVLFSFNIHWKVERVTSYTQYRGSRKEVTRMLHLADPETFEERNCLIWVWIVLLDSWRAGLTVLEEGMNLSYQFVDAFEIYEDWDTIEVILHQFFWHEELALEWKKCWTQLRIVGRP